MPPDKPRRLGRGLDALLAARPLPAASGDRSALQRLAVSQIRPNPFQPRKEFNAEELAELEASLRTSGLLQPITVRPAPSGSGFELVAGERRLRAASRLGWVDIPAVVKEIDDRMLLTLALVENLQRSDLTPLEEAEGYQRLVSDFGLTQQQLSEVIGKDRSTIANMLRLLDLPASVRRMLQQGQLTLGHARALLALGSEQAMSALAREVVRKGLSVRDVEQRVRATAPESRKRPRAGQSKSAPVAELRRVEDELRGRLQTDVRVTLDESSRGNITIAFYSADDLERVLDIVLGPSRERS